MHNSHRQTGFTLVEVLVAILIFALMSAVAYRGLDSVLASEMHISEKDAQWSALALTFGQMQQDFNLAVARPIRNTVDQQAAAISGRKPPLGAEDVQLALTLMQNGQDDAAVWRVGYRLRSGRLEYLVWPAADQAPQARPRTITLMEHMSKFELRFLDASGSWQPQWPDKTGTAFPRAVEISLQSEGLAPVTRIFTLP